MNSTDEEKRAIRKMFTEPIDEVQVAMNELVMEESGLSISTDYHLRLNSYMGTLQVKIDNLKAMLPVIHKMFKKPIEEVQAAFDAYEEAYDENCTVVQFGDHELLDKTMNDLQGKIDNLFNTLPVIQP